jgi:hypothetical protein
MKRFLIFPAVCLLLGCVPEGAQAQSGAAATYRAYFDAAPDVRSEEDALRPYYTRAALDTLHTLKETQPEAIAFVAGMQRAVFAEAQIDSIATTAQTAQTATLRVHLSPKDPESRRDLIITTASMEKENGAWKIVREESEIVSHPEQTSGGAEDSMEGKASAEVAAGDCPAEATYGDAGAANTLTLEGDAGRRRLGFEEVVVVLEGVTDEPPDLTIRFPAFGPADLTEQGARFEYALSVSGFDPEAAEQRATLRRGTYLPQSLGCFPTNPAAGEEAGHLTVERYEEPGEAGGTLTATFARPTGEPGRNRLSARIDTRQIVDLRPRPLGPGNLVVLSSGERQAADSGYALYDPGGSSLVVELNYSSVTRTGGGRYVLEAFGSAPGVYAGDPGFGEVEVFVIEAFGEGDGLRGEKRVVPEEEMPTGGTLTAQQARQLGALEAQFAMDEVVTVPVLAPLSISPVP